MQVQHERSDGVAAAGWRRAVRVDRSRLAQAERTASGGVRIPGSIARAGVLTYQRADGTTIRELLPPEELGRAESLATLRDAPITVGHPPADRAGSQLVTPENYRSLSVGHVSGDAVVEAEHVNADLVVLDGSAIAKIDSGELIELSPGYTCLIDPTPGTWHGESYDQVQRHRIYNHVALLPEGGARGGSSVALRIDGVDDYAAMVSAANPLPQREERADMSTERIDGQSYRVGSPEWRDALVRRMTRLDEENARLKEEKEDAEKEKEKAEREKEDAEKEKEKADLDIEKLKAERDALKAQLAELEAKLAELEDPENLDARADARAELLELARRFLGGSFEFVRTDGRKQRRLTDREIKLEVLAKLAPGIALDDKPDAYIDARFDAEVEIRRSAPSEALSQARRAAFPGLSSRADSGGLNQHTVGRKPPPNIYR